MRGPRPSPLDDSATTTRPSLRANRRSRNISFRFHRPGGNRTPNRRFWRPVLYQLSYGPNPAESPRLHNKYERQVITDCGQLGSMRHSEFVLNGWLTGIEPATPGATVRCSNQLSYSHHQTTVHLESNQKRIQTAKLLPRIPTRRHSNGNAAS